MVTLHNVQDCLKIAYISLNKVIILLILDILQVSKITSISQLIHIIYIILWIFVHKKPHNMTPNKSGTSGNNNVLHIVLLFFSSKGAGPLLLNL